MAHFDIQDFREELRHEFDGNVYSIEPILRGIYAYKLDGVTSHSSISLKQALQMQHYKTSDYLRYTGSQVDFIEFSDLVRKEAELMSRKVLYKGITHIDNALHNEVQRSIVKPLLKRLYQEQPQELEEKFKGTQAIYKILLDKEILPISDAKEVDRFYIVYPPLARNSISYTNIVRMINTIKSTLRSKIPRASLREVVCLPYDSFSRAVS